LTILTIIMMTTAPEWLLFLLLKTMPPGTTPYSVVRADCPPAAEVCEGARRSSFYGGWVRQETAAEGKARYAQIIDAFERARQAITCRAITGEKIEGCEVDPLPPFKAWLPFMPRQAIPAGLSVAVEESGIREDVQVGRGRSGKPSDDGGEGRGPSGEVCFVQLHPKIAWMFVREEDGGVDQATLDRAREGDKAARETVALSLVGVGPEPIERCFRAGFRALSHTRHYCSVARPDLNWVFSMYSLYGTGTTCASANNGKTTRRQRTFWSISEMLTRPRKAPPDAK
jgi:hypothetical protein